MKKLTKSILLIVAILINTAVLGQKNDSNKNNTNDYYKILHKYYKEDSKLLKEKSEKEQKQFKRWEWYWSSRYDAIEGYDKITKISNEFIARNQENANSELLKSATISNNLPINWSCIGPFSNPIGNTKSYIGQIVSVWADPDRTDIVYAGGRNGGLWKKTSSTDWTCLTDEIFSFGVIDIAVHPTNLNKIYIATGCWAAGGTSTKNGDYGFGVFYSNDGGTTWVTNTMTSVPETDLFFRKILIDPINPDIIYALSRKTVYKSINGGATWINTHAPTLVNDTEYYDMVMKPNDTSTLYISAHSHEIYRTTTAANTWESTNLANNLSWTGVKWKIGIAVSEANPEKLFVAYTKDTTNGEYYSFIETSTNKGNSWTPIVNNKFLYSRNYTPLRLAVSPTNENAIIVGGIHLYKYNGSGGLSNIHSGVHDDIRKVLFAKDGTNEQLYVGHDGGLSRSDNYGLNWTSIDDGLATGLFLSLSSSTTTSDKLIVGTMDCHCHIYESGLWTNTGSGDGGSTLIDYSNDNIIYTLFNTKLYKTTNNGTSWYYKNKDLIEYDSEIFMHPTNPSTIYCGPYNFSVSYDGGNNWSNLKTGIGRVTGIDIHPTNPNIIYFTSVTYDYTVTPYYPSSHIYKSIDAGNNSTEITNNSTIGSLLTNNPIRTTGIKINPLNSNQVWLTVGSLIDGEKVYESNNGGLTWNNISFNLDNFPIQCIEYDEVNRCIYVGTDIGVYYKNDGENTWSRLGNNLPYVLVTDLEINKLTGKLYAATLGRAAWEAELPGWCYDASTITLTSNTNWNSPESICNNIVVDNNSTLTVSSSIALSHLSKITVKNGSKLIVTFGGTISNANIEIQSGGYIKLENGGTLELNTNDELNILLGATSDIPNGEIKIL